MPAPRIPDVILATLNNKPQPPVINKYRQTNCTLSRKKPKRKCARQSGPQVLHFEPYSKDFSDKYQQIMNFTHSLVCHDINKWRMRAHSHVTSDYLILCLKGGSGS